ncbi:hypothetical protein DB42_BV00460 [Neochlamydia sp. EPS4]|nr:hypothetical protein DB42_BV00460 [Neochlamydia sp. EPS4]
MLAETAMYRFKRSFGGDFPPRKLAYQQAELYAKSLVMNKRTKLEMPKAMGANLCDISLEELLDHLRNKAPKSSIFSFEIYLAILKMG